MVAINATTDNCAFVLGVLKSATGPLAAIEIAERAGIGGKHETRRRKIRAIVSRLRDGGHWICSSIHDGYYLTRDRDEWKLYQDERMIEAKQTIGNASQNKKMLTDSAGQGFLFRVAPGYGDR